jgi:hypothetical protein
MRELLASGGLADFHGNRFQLYVRVLRQPAKGRSVSPTTSRKWTATIATRDPHRDRRHPSAESSSAEPTIAP